MADNLFKVVQKPEERLRRLEKAGAEVRLDKLTPIRRYYKSGAEMYRMANNYYEDECLDKAYHLYHKYLSLFIEKVSNFAGLFHAERVERKNYQYHYLADSEASRLQHCSGCRQGQSAEKFKDGLEKM